MRCRFEDYVAKGTGWLRPDPVFAAPTPSHRYRAGSWGVMGCTTKEKKGLPHLAARRAGGSPALRSEKENMAHGWGLTEWNAPATESWPRPEPPQGCSSPAVGSGARQGPRGFPPCSPHGSRELNKGRQRAPLHVCNEA